MMPVRGALLLILWQTLALAAQDLARPIELPRVDVTQVDSSVNPCEDFHRYVCAKRAAADPMPPDQTWWGPFGELEEWNHQVLRGILERYEASSRPRTPNEQKIGDFYAACMNQARSKANDLPVIQPLLNQISAMRSKRDIARVLAAMHRTFDAPWTQGDNQTDAALLGYGPQPDFNDVSHVIAGVDQGGLGMPTRDFYLKNDDESKSIRAKYLDFVASLLKLSGRSADEAAKDASTILRLETAMAQVQMDNVARRDPKKTNNRYTLAQLEALTPEFDWDAYLNSISAPAVSLYEVSAPEFFRGLNRLLGGESLDSWKAYLQWHLLRAAAPILGNSWRDANFAFSSVLNGEKKQPPDWRRCVETVDKSLGQALGQAYVAQVFPPESKGRTRKMVDDIEAAMDRDLEAITWMQPETKRQAREKLAALIDKIGYPDTWIDYGSLTITHNSYPENVERATAFELRRQLGFIGKPLDRTQWSMTPPTVDAYEDSQQNAINFPAGMLQPAFFDPTTDDVINYGAIGVVMGHELTHDFDDQGRKFDAKGNLRDWWTARDATEYEERGACIAKEYTGPVPGVPGVQQDGRLTQGEDTADNGGIYLALSALTEDLSREGKTLDDKDAHGLTNLQRFFIAYATIGCDQVRQEEERTWVLSNPHSLPLLRVNNVLGNMPEFQRAFSCKTNEPMVHAARCRVW